MKVNIRTILLTLVLSAGLIFPVSAQEQEFDPDKTTKKFQTLLYFIEHMYVDSVNGDELVEEAIRSMLEDLDPHSTYFSKEDLKAANEPLNGNFEGIGVQFNILKDTIFVVAPISGGPSEKVGIMAGDKIVEIEGENVAGIGITNRDVMDKLKGPKDTKVEVGIKRGGVKRILDFEIIRDKIPIYSVDAAYMATPEIGYVKVNRFARTTMSELQEAIVDLKEQGMQELILDLQGNGGGLLNTAIEMADEFLPEDQMIVYTQGRAFPKNEVFSTREGLWEKGKLVVLIDEGSASASEIVSGAIQDWDRGLVMGRRSFGKGLVQRPVNLPDGSAVRLTVQKYYTPSGRCIQKPYDEGIEAYRREKLERIEHGELWHPDSIDFPDSLRYQTNIKKRVVYGGGGIFPDIFVPLDTSGTSEYFSQLVRRGLTNSFVLNYMDKNRNELADQFKSAEDFVKNYKVDEELKKELIAYAESKEVEFDEAGFENSEEVIEIRLKALIARNLYDYSTFYQVINELNATYNRAIEALQDGTFEKLDLAYSKLEN
ncbi:S41 family peptidase [Halocola ammonii]